MMSIALTAGIAFFPFPNGLLHADGAFFPGSQGTIDDIERRCGTKVFRGLRWIPCTITELAPSGSKVRCPVCLRGEDIAPRMVREALSVSICTCTHCEVWYATVPVDTQYYRGVHPYVVNMDRANWDNTTERLQQELQAVE